MALSDEQIRELAEDGLFFSSIYEITRAIEAEVRKDDTELIRQLVDALERSIAITMGQIDRNAALIAGRARLEEKPCA